MSVYLCRYGVVVTLYLTTEGSSLCGVGSSFLSSTIFLLLLSFFIFPCSTCSFSPALHPSSNSMLTRVTCAGTNENKIVGTSRVKSSAASLVAENKLTVSVCRGCHCGLVRSREVYRLQIKGLQLWTVSQPR